MERLIDAAAREMGIDQVAMRKLNHIKPEEMPYKTASGTTYDSGEFTALLDKALTLADVDGLRRRARKRARRAASCAARGIGDYLEVTAPPMNEMGGLRFEDNGDVTIITGTLDYGQGHWSAVRPGADHQARHPVPQDQADAGRQRPADRGRRHRRLASRSWPRVRRSSKPPTR